jgi:CheY-like chemotaxis protein
MDRERYCIMVVEDNAADVELLRFALDSAGLDYEFALVEDGDKALVLVKENTVFADGRLPDLVILDINVPRHDGLEILEYIRADAAFARIPVVILTSSSSPREKEKLAALGIARHIEKPCDLDEFVKIGAVLREILESTA